MDLELQLRELSIRIQNVIQLISSGGGQGRLDHNLVKQLDEISARCDSQYENDKFVDPADIKLMNNLISLIELNL
jgi:hypothetical protein